MPVKRPAGEAQNDKPPAKKRRVSTEQTSDKLPVLAHQSLKALAKAAQKARTFEGQKITRRMKKVEAQEEIQALEAELDAIKSADIDLVSKHALKQFLHEHPEHVERFGWNADLPSDIDDLSQSSKAIKRLLQSKAMLEGFAALAARFGGGVAGAKSNSKKSEKTNQKLTTERSVKEGRSSTQESSDSDKENNALKAVKLKSTKLKSQKSQTKAKATTSAVDTAISSTFLPSLSAGFTLGDSDAEDDGFQYSDSAEENLTKPERKNRRGQRARQKIWERKYGKEAKHVKKSQEAENLAQAAIAAKKRARLPSRVREAVQGGAVDSRTHSPHKDRPLAQAAVEHPSWQAKRKQQEAVAQAAFKGKKITFN